MAKVKFTAILGDMRGKVDSTVFSRNRYGAYTRTKVTPSNPSTARQIAVRSKLSEYSTGWKALTDLQREMWRNAVNDWQKIDIFGKPQKPTGMGLYIKVNIALNQINRPSINVPPNLNGSNGQIHTRTNWRLEIPDTNNIAIAWDGGPLSDDNALLIRVTPMMSVGITFVKSEFRFLFAIANNQNSPTSFWNPYINKFGNLQSGTAIFCEAWIVSNTSGKSIRCAICKGVVP